MRSRFDEQLADLNKKLIEMGAMCEECISLAAKALKEIRQVVCGRQLQSMIFEADIVCRRSRFAPLSAE